MRGLGASPFGVTRTIPGERARAMVQRARVQVAPSPRPAVSRETVYVAAFGTLWGLLEITLGTALKGLRIPFTGMLMASLATILFLAGRRFAPRRGSILMMGGIAALLKIFSLGGFVLGPVWAIVLEAAVAEAAIGALGLHRLSCILAAILVLAYTTVHPLLTQALLYGPAIVRIYAEMLRLAAHTARLDGAGVPVLIAGWLGAVSLLGAAVGLMGDRLGRRLEERIGRLRGQGERA